MKLLEDIDTPLSEAITNPPRNLGVYLKMRVRHFTEIKERASKLKRELNSIDTRFFEDFVSDLLIDANVKGPSIPWGFPPDYAGRRTR